MTQLGLRALDRLARLLRRNPAGVAEHVVTGKQGEEAAYFHLRRLGYRMVARNYRSPRRRGEIDLIGWDGEVLCFIEVKSRTSREVKPAEAAVDDPKQRELAAMARDYLRRLPQQTACRFDVVSVYYESGGAPPESAVSAVPTDITLFRNAFSICNT